MEIQKIILDDSEDDEISIGLVRLAKQMPDYEFFFLINRMNSFCFKRIDDLVTEGIYYSYHYPVFEGYSKDTKDCFHFISNRSSQSIQKKEITELFSDEQDFNFLLNNFQEADYIIKSSEKFPDFSLILLPENLTFQIQEIPLSSNEELYQTLQYYE